MICPKSKRKKKLASKININHSHTKKPLDYLQLDLYLLLSLQNLCTYSQNIKLSYEIISEVLSSISACTLLIH